MNISANHVYSRVKAAITTEYANAFVTSERLPAPPEFPCVEIVEMDSYPEREATTINLTDDQRRSVFEVQAFSNKADIGTIEAKTLIEIATAEFRKMGYRCTTSSPLPNAADTTIKRHVARYTRFIGGDDKFYDEED